MMDHILKTIDKKAEEEIAKILKEKEETILRLEKEYSRRIEAKRKEQKEEAETMAKKEVEEFEKAKQVELNFQIQEKKNEIIKEVYEKARREIAEIGDGEMEKLISRLARLLPARAKGQIEADKKTAGFLKRIFSANDARITPSLEEEGFVFKSEDVEIDMRFSQALSELREDANPGLVRMLFS